MIHRFDCKFAIILAALTISALTAGCDGFLGKSDNAPPPTTGDTVTVASFNIQVFGTTKSKDDNAMEILAKVIRRFDVIAIQEIRSKDQSLIDRFVARINADGSHYRSVLGPRLGRTTSKEQYAYIYNAATIELIPGSVYTVDDRDDLLHRPPLVARFRVRGPPTDEAFTFTLVNIHTDPDETEDELDALAGVFQAVQNNGSGEDDVILLGDLNEPPKKYGRLGRLPGMRWALTSQKTNTRRNRSYDNLLFNANHTAEFTRQAGVLDLQKEYGLSLKEALKVSDHLPVWAAFSAKEHGPRRVALGGGVRRE